MQYVFLFCSSIVLLQGGKKNEMKYEERNNSCNKSQECLSPYWAFPKMEKR